MTLEEDMAELNRRFDDHFADFSACKSTLAATAELQKQNTEDIAELTEATAELVSAWSAAKQFQAFVKWLGGFALVAATIAYFSDLFAHVSK